MAEQMSYPPYPGYGAPPADPYAAYAGYGAGAYGAPPYVNPDEVRTIFITGFPQDVKERELNNLLRFLPGYEASQMNWKNDQAQGFALFTTAMQARTALEGVNTLMFDETTVLRAEMAHKNMYLKEDANNPTKRPRTQPGAPGAPGGAPGYATYPGAAAAGAFPGAPSAATSSGPRSYTPVTNQHDNPPCNTLFIGNLGDHTTEADLRTLFEQQPGFVQLKLVRSTRCLNAFVEFTDVASAVQCHQSQQGAVVGSSDRGGIRIQYSKNPYGKKRERDAIPGAAGAAAAAGAAPGGAAAAPGYTGYDPATYVAPAAVPETTPAMSTDPAEPAP